MTKLLFISLVCALFGSWHLCLAFIQHSQKNYSLNYQSYFLPWLFLGQVFAVAGVVMHYFDFSIYFAIPCLLFSMVALSLTGKRICYQSNLTHSLWGVGAYSLFVIVVSLFLHISLRLLEPFLKTV